MDYYPRELNITIIEYLDNEAESLKLLEILKIDGKYYTSKEYYEICYITTFKTKYKIKNVIINTKEELNEIKQLVDIKGIKFGCDFNEIVNGLLPKNLKYLEFGDSFDKEVNNLPEKVKHLTFGVMFNQPVDMLPKSISHLTFGQNFDRLVDNLPKNLTHLTFGAYFDKIVNKLPDHLTHLTFGYWFDQPVNNLPSKIKHLTFGRRFDKPVDKLPKKIAHLTVNDLFDRVIDLKKYKKMKIINLYRKSQKDLISNSTSSNCKIIVQENQGLVNDLL